MAHFARFCCLLLMVTSYPIAAFAAETTPLALNAKGTWEAGKEAGDWSGQFAVFLDTGAVSGHVRLSSGDYVATVNVIGKASGMSFVIEGAPSLSRISGEDLRVTGQTSGDTIGGKLLLPNGSAGTWVGELALMKGPSLSKKERAELISGTPEEAVETISRLPTARVAPEIREGLEAGIPQDVFVEFDRKLATARVRFEQLARRVSAEDRASMRELRADTYSAVKSEVLSVVAGVDLEPKRDYRNLLSTFVTLKSVDALDRLLAQPSVTSITGNTRYHESSVTQSRQLIQATQTYSLGYRGQGTVFAVIDSGLDWTESSVFGACPTGPDPTGVNCNVLLLIDTAPNDGFADGNGTEFKHGTNVARNAQYVAAAAHIISYDAQSSDGDFPKEYIWAAMTDLIDQTATYNIVAVNISIGSGARFSSQEECDADPEGAVYKSRMEELWDAGIISVVSAGNDAAPALEIPACVSRAVSVGAVYDANGYGNRFYYPNNFLLCSDNTTAADQVACFSNATSFLALLAPGAFNEGVQGEPEVYGTSFAAPWVTGAVAALRGTNRFQNDDPECTRRRLRKTGTPVVDSRSGTPMTFPRVDVLAAVNTPFSVGDCNLNLKVNINELIVGVNIALGNQPLQACPAFDADQSGTVSINELIAGVNTAVSGDVACPIGVS